MPGPCLAPTPRISLDLDGVTGGLIADIVPSAVFAGNGVALRSDGLYVPGYLDLLGSGFPTIPGSPPADLLVRATPQANVSWTFRYNALDTSSTKWEFIGGADYFANIETAGTITTSVASGTYGAWQDLSGTDVVGPDFNTPFTGTYNISWGAEINPVGGEQAQVGISIAGADPTDNNTATASATNNTSVMRRRSVALNSGDRVRLNYRGTGTGSPHTFQRRWISVVPVRVTGARGSTYGGT